MTHDAVPVTQRELTSQRELTRQQRDMIKRAQQEYPGQIIEPPAKKTELSECFTEWAGRLYFWFNVGKNTHVITEKKETRPV